MEKNRARTNTVYTRTAICPIHNCHLQNGRCIACEAQKHRDKLMESQRLVMTKGGS